MCATAGLVTTVVERDDVADVVSALRNPLLFLVFAVPLAVLLGKVGVFAAPAARVTGGRHLLLSLWVLAAAVVVVFDLDAAVVMLTPLYIRIARRHGLSVEALAFQPALLACLASSLLPVSNLTNLLAAEELDLDASELSRRTSPTTSPPCWPACRRCTTRPRSWPCSSVPTSVRCSC